MDILIQVIMKTENGKCVVQFEILSQGMFTLYIYFKDVLNPLIQENLQSYIGVVKRNIQECQSHWDEVKSFASTVLPQQQVSPAFLKSMKFSPRETGIFLNTWRTAPLCCIILVL